MVRAEVSDKEFVEGIRQHSKIKMEQLYKLHFPMVLQFILNNNGTQEDAKDIYQESIMVLYNKVQEGSFKLQSQLKTFLYSVSRHLWLKKLQAKKNYTALVKDFEESIPVEENWDKLFEKEIQFKILNLALEQLGQPCKAILEEFYIQGLSMEDLSEKFGYTNADNAKNQKYKCLLRLKKIFFFEFSKERSE